MLKVNDKVKPTGEANLTYGYVRKSWVGTAKSDGRFYDGKNMVMVYWPEIKKVGQWSADTLVKI